MLRSGSPVREPHAYGYGRACLGALHVRCASWRERRGQQAAVEALSEIRDAPFMG